MRGHGADRGPIRVGLELTALELDRSGMGRAIAALRRELHKRDDVELVPLGQPGAERSRAGAARLTRGLSRELAWFPLRLPRAAARRRLDLLHCPSPLAPPRSPVPLVVTIPDALAWRHPRWTGAANLAHLRTVARHAARRASAVLTLSEFSREEICDALGLAPERVFVAPLGVDPGFAPGPADEEMLAALGVERPYLLTVATLQPRKNLEAALRAFELLREAGDPHSLVIAGARGWSDRRLLSRLRASRVADRIVLAGRVSDGELVALYRGADCLVHPSRYEGFGLPVLEAMACGTAVVCSDRASLPEVTGDAAVLVNPEEPEAIAAAIADLLDSPDRRRILSERGARRANAFTWSRHAEQVVTAYRRAAS